MNKCTPLLVLFIIFLMLISGCMLVNPAKRRPVDSISYKENVQQIKKSVLVHFTELIPQKTLVETVWDNNGAFWNQKESTQIGYTQDYEIIPVPGSATAVVRGTRIVIPFGRYLTEMTKSAVQKTFEESSFCYEPTCVEYLTQQQQYDLVLTVGIEDFRVWESPMNKINYSSSIQYSARSSEGTDTDRIQKTLSEKSVGSVFSTSYSFIAKMKEITNDYTQEIATELMVKAFPGE